MFKVIKKRRPNINCVFCCLLKMKTMDMTHFGMTSHQLAMQIVCNDSIVNSMLYGVLPH